MSRPGARRTVLSGWGRSAPTGADLVRPVDVAMAGRLVAAGDDRGVLARGLGRSYGDAAQNAGGLVLDATALDGVRSFDPVEGTIEVAAGCSLDRLLRLVVPLGWFPHVTPGTRQVTVGGALAADVHGKNHHVDGTWSRGVVSFDLLAPVDGGEVRTVDEASDPDVFAATAGGMGLTGVVTAQRLRLQPIPSSRLLVDTERVGDVDTLLDLMRTGDDAYRFSVAWIDCLATGSSLGRSVLTRGDWAPVDALPVTDRAVPHAFDPAGPLPSPPWLPGRTLNPVTVAAFNELWFRRAPRERRREVQSVAAFFHPLDAVAGWNRVYGRRGFLQHQFVVPDGAEAVLRRVLERLSRARVASFLAVLKRFGPAGAGHLSFPRPGWTLALDLPLGDDRLPRLLRGFDEEVAAAGGRVYLAKDATLAPDLLPAMYPRLEEWRAVRRTLDPEGVLTSDLDRRLDLSGRSAS